MSASRKQIALIEELQARGAVIPADDDDNPDNSIMDSVEAADAYIKKWGHLMRKYSTKSSAADYGNIPNH